jgi:hypothetical protein
VTVAVILNPPSLAAAGLTVVQGLLSVSVLVRSTAVLRALRRARTAEEQDLAEIESLRPALQALVLLVILLASTGLLIQTLASYVPLWPTIFCIDGVTRIGVGTVGAARHLAPLLDGLAVTKPLAVLLGAAWCVVHAVGRRSRTRPGAHGPLVLVGFAVVTLLDATGELAYLLIPKEERFLSTGCCLIGSMPVGSGASLWERTGGTPTAAVAVAVLAAGAALWIAGLGMLGRHRPEPAPRSAAGFVLAGAAVVSLAAQHVLVAVASPALTGVAEHRCGWCVLEHAPLTGWSAGLLGLAVGASLLAVFAAWRERTRPDAGGDVSRTLARGAAGIAALAALGLALGSI